MAKARALKKAKSCLPDTPNRRAVIINELMKEITPQNESVENKIVKSIKKMVKDTKYKRDDEARAAMNVISIAVSSVDEVGKNAIAKKTGISRKRIYAGYKKALINDYSETAAYRVTKRKCRSDKLSEECKQRIYDWWISPKASRPSPNKADLKKKRIDVHIFVNHQAHILEKTQTEVYEEFKKENTDLKVSQRSFERLKPFFIRQMRAKDRVTCCCRKHVELKMIFKKCMDYRRKILQDQQHTSQYCIYERVMGLVEDTLCKTESTNHKLECLERRCALCGVSKLQLHPAELSTSENVEWSKYDYQDIMSKSGDSRRRLMLVQQITSPHEMYQYLLKLLKDFPAHNFRANWQADQMKSVQENLPSNSCLVVHDYSENYRCIQKQELQSTYFNRPEITLHVSVIYRRAILEIDGEDENNIIRELFFVLSDDQTHDHIFVSMVQQKIKEYLDSINYNVEHMIEFTDGCSVQYKSRNCMGLLSEICDKLNFKTFSRNYFETSHGKGEQDAAGGAIKRHLEYSSMKGNYIQNAASAYNILMKSFTEPKAGIYKRRIFRLLEDVDRTNSKKFKPIPENRKIHQIFTESFGHLVARHQSCYSCNACLSVNPSACENMSQTDTFRNIKTRQMDCGTLLPDLNEYEVTIILFSSQ